MHPVRSGEYSFERVGLDVDAVDGPFLLRSGRFGLLLSLRGAHGGSLPTASEIHWSRTLPPAAGNAPLYVFVRRGHDVLCLGEAIVARHGRLAKDGFTCALTLTEPLAETTWRELVADATRPLAPPPEELVAALSAQSKTGDRIEALRLFAARWFGCPDDAPLAATHPAAPWPLAVLHGLVETTAVCRQNRFVPLQELEILDSKLVFYVENQGAFVWATETTGDDPPVYVRPGGGSTPWTLEAPSLSAFLVQALVLEAVFGAAWSASQPGVEARELARVAKRVPPLSLTPWIRSKTRFYGGNGIIGIAFENGDTCDVWLGAKERGRFEPLETLVADWERVTL